MARVSDLIVDGEVQIYGKTSFSDEVNINNLTIKNGINGFYNISDLDTYTKYQLIAKDGILDYDSNQEGALQILFPVNLSFGYINMIVDIYENNQCSTYYISGYMGTITTSLGTSGQWTGVTANSIGNGNNGYLPVRFLWGVKSGQSTLSGYSITIGNYNTIWNNPKITIRNVKLSDIPLNDLVPSQVEESFLIDFCNNNDILTLHIGIGEGENSQTVENINAQDKIIISNLQLNSTELEILNSNNLQVPTGIYRLFIEVEDVSTNKKDLYIKDNAIWLQYNNTEITVNNSNIIINKINDTIQSVGAISLYLRYNENNIGTILYGKTSSQEQEINITIKLQRFYEF